MKKARNNVKLNMFRSGKLKLLTAILLVAVLLAGMMAGCTQSEDTSGDAASTTDPGATNNGAAADNVDHGKALLSINGVDVYEDEYNFWTNQTMSSVGYTPDTDVDWMLDETGNSELKSFLEGETENSLKTYHIIALQAEELGITLTEEEQAEVDGIYESVLNNYFGNDVAALEADFSSTGMNRELLESNEKVIKQYNKMIAEQYGENGENLSDEEVLAWAEENGVLRAKHILFKVQNDDGTPLPEEEIAAANEDAIALYNELAAAKEEMTEENFLQRFDEDMQEKSGDPGKQTSPDGYQFMPYTMMPAFEDAILALQPGEISPPVDITYGWSIILRLPLDLNAETLNASGTLKSSAASSKFGEQLDKWLTDATVEKYPAYSEWWTNKINGE
jgi:hypothetical protein